MSLKNEASSEPAERELVITRFLDAPRELVFRAWTDPAQVSKWWGPQGFSLTTREMNVRPGGVWRFTMHAPDGVDYDNKIVYIEIVSSERLVYTHEGEGETDGGQFQVMVTFAQQGAGTKLTMRMLFQSAAERDRAVREIGAIEGANQTLDRLERHLAEIASQGAKEAIYGSRRSDRMRTVVSRDGTPIAFDQSGAGAPIILVGGALSDRSAAVQLAALLAPRFAVYAYDRRGRGDSGDTPPYAPLREVEDIEALIDEAGGPAFVFGHSSGAVLALEAARVLAAKIKKLALYEPPFIVDDTRARLPHDYAVHLNKLVTAGRRGDAVEYFMTKAVDVPAEFIPQMRNDPMWPAMEAVAHTIAYDGAIMGDSMNGSPSPLEKWASVAVPTLVLDGGASPAWIRNAAQALADLLPNARHHTLEGQGHGPASEVLVPVLIEFFAE